MQVLQVGDVPEYIERLRKEPDQIDLLFGDFLIGVTHFFRDPEAFAVLESEVMPKLVESKKTTDQIRIWVPGCATGEEVLFDSDPLERGHDQAGNRAEGSDFRDRPR